MIVTKARDHSLVQLTRELAEWLMTTPRYGQDYGIKVFVDAKLEKSKRFDTEGLLHDNAVVRERNLLHFWTPELCAYADTFDIVITVRQLVYLTLILARRRWNCIVYLLAVSADCTARHIF